MVELSYMRLIIKPEKPNFRLIVEAQAYKEVWKANSRKILKAFRDITHLDFKQKVITAHVHDNIISLSGYRRTPMKLHGRGRTSDDKLFTIVHELCHRLLGGNGLRTLTPESLSKLDDHKLMYLFESDVVRAALGNEMTEKLETFELRDSLGKDSIYLKEYLEAWQWAMNMTLQQRQEKLNNLITAKRYDKVL